MFSLFFIVGAFLFIIFFLLFWFFWFCGEFFCFMFNFLFFSFGGYDFGFVFVFDWISLVFFSVVSLISAGVFFYSFFYMGMDWLSNRFIWLVFLFVISMGLLVFGGNFFVTMLGWDGLGITSFFLVVFYQSVISGVSGLITVYTNRVGDVLFLFVFGWLIFCGDFSFDGLIFSGYWLMLFIIFGCFVKSAQVPFSAWLPAAMAAPTPVSSLVHSSTLVTAGVYVMIRYNLVFFQGVWIFLLVSFTVFLTGFVALMESDFKKLVAMSTLSQLGVMFYALVVGFWKLAFLHMVVHALFKASLFLGVGLLMSICGGGQDYRSFGWGWFSIIFVLLVGSSFCLCGVPFLVGFYSKDFIISSGGFIGLVSFFWFFLGCFFTVYYSFRLLKIVVSKMIFGNGFIVVYLSFWGFLSFCFLWLMFIFGGSVIFSFVFGDFLMVFDGFFCIIGLILFIFGSFISFFIIFFVFFFIKLLFLSYLSGSGFSLILKSGSLYLMGERNWSEVLGGFGIYKILGVFSNKFSFNSFFWMFGGSIVFMFSFLWIFFV